MLFWSVWLMILLGLPQVLRRQKGSFSVKVPSISGAEESQACGDKLISQLLAAMESLLLVIYSCPSVSGEGRVVSAYGDKRFFQAPCYGGIPFIGATQLFPYWVSWWREKFQA